jgi:prepilin peptidase CpaA
LLVLLILLSLPAFAAGWAGGGDVKLLAAVGLWVDFRGALGLLSCIFIAGGVIAAASLLLRQRRLSKSSTGVPYGVAIAICGAIMLAYPALLQSRAAPANPLDLHAARAAARPRHKRLRGTASALPSPPCEHSLDRAALERRRGTSGRHRN